MPAAPFTAIPDQRPTDKGDLARPGSVPTPPGIQARESRRTSHAVHEALDVLARFAADESKEGEGCSSRVSEWHAVEDELHDAGDNGQGSSLRLLSFTNPFASTRPKGIRRSTALRRGLLRQGSSPRPHSTFPPPPIPTHVIVASMFADSTVTLLDGDLSANTSATVTHRASLADPYDRAQLPYCDVPQSYYLSGAPETRSINSAAGSSLDESHSSHDPHNARPTTSQTIRLIRGPSSSAWETPSTTESCIPPLESWHRPSSSITEVDPKTPQSVTCEPREISLSLQNLSRPVACTMATESGTSLAQPWFAQGGCTDNSAGSQVDGTSQSSLDGSQDLVTPLGSLPARHGVTATCVSQQSKASLAATLPTEILLQIYKSLAPIDFHHARHTCSNWIRASLDHGLLLTMLQRSGLSTSTIDSHATGVRLDNIQSLQRYDPWKISCFLARECALNGGLNGDKSSPVAAGHACSSAFIENSSDPVRSVMDEDTSQCSRPIFQASPCGLFILVADRGIVSIYVLEGGNSRLLTSIICPQTVLAMSMDTSSPRFAVAALLEGRMGIVSDLSLGRDDSGHIVRLAHPDATTSRLEPTARHVSMNGQPYSDASSTSTSLDQINSHAVHGTESDIESDGTFDAVDLQSNHELHQLSQTDQPGLYDRNWINQAWNLHLRSRGVRTVPRRNADEPGVKFKGSTTVEEADTCSVESGYRSIYQRVGSDMDPARSVAICPQRRCVAFGCATGVELHWVDALTGRDLSRWFPLQTCSDFLYFLPPRIGIDSAKKLRLISSAAHPAQKSTAGRVTDAGRTQLGSSWTFSGTEEQNPRAAVSISNCDHYRAVPLADGFHVLFTDPITGDVCLGTDGPLGGTNRLLRKFVFLPPSGWRDPRATAAGDSAQASSTQALRAPRLYTATQELRLGPRIVCVYDSEVMLYTVPLDAFTYSQVEHLERQQLVTGDHGVASGDEGPTGSRHWLNWWPREVGDTGSDRTTSPSSETINAWPLHVRGIHVGRLEGVLEIAVNEVPGGDLNIWAFTEGGRTITWQLDLGRGQSPSERQMGVGDGEKLEHDLDNDWLALTTNRLPSVAARRYHVGPPLASKPPCLASCSLDGAGSCPDMTTSKGDYGQPEAPANVWCMPRGVGTDCGNVLSSIGATRPGYGFYDAHGDLFFSYHPLDRQDLDTHSG